MKGLEANLHVFASYSDSANSQQKPRKATLQTLLTTFAAGSGRFTPSAYIVALTLTLSPTRHSALGTRLAKRTGLSL